MGKISTNIVKSGFQRKKSPQYKLSILFGIDSLSYVVKDSDGAVLLLRRYDLFSEYGLTDEPFYTRILKKIWVEDEDLNQVFGHCHTAFLSPYFSIVPNKLFEPQHRASYLEPLKGKSATQSVYLNNELAAQNAQLVFSLPKLAVDFLETIYSSDRLTLYNSIAPLVNAFGEETKNLNDKYVWVNVHPQVLQVILFDGKDLLFANQYEFQTDKDFIYFALLVYDQFRLNPKEVPMYLTGQLLKSSTIYDHLYRYVQHFYFVDPPSNYHLDSQSLEFPLYFYYDLLVIN